MNYNSGLFFFKSRWFYLPLRYVSEQLTDILKTCLDLEAKDENGNQTVWKQAEF